MSSENRHTRKIRITGKVQGVYYRQSTVQKARDLGCTGTVRNDSDGSVEIICTGTEEQLNRLVEWCYTGPTRAIVTNVIVEEMPEIRFEDFRIIR